MTNSHGGRVTARAVWEMARSLRWRAQSVRRVTGLLSKMAMARLVVAEVFQAERERPAARTAVPVRVKSMDGRVVWLRPRSSDRAAFEFLYQGYHLPPEPTGRVARIAVLGANIGLLLGDLADRYPHARLLGVEPDPDNATLARRNLAHLGARCTLLEAAAWHRDEQLTLSWDADAWGQTLARSPDRGRAAVALQVDAVTTGQVRVDRSMPEGCSTCSATRDRSTTCSSTSNPPGTRCSSTVSGPGTSGASRSRSMITTTRRCHCSRRWAIVPSYGG